MTIDPRWSIFLGLFISILAYVGAAGALLLDMGLDATMEKRLIACVLFTFGLLNTVQTFLTGVPSKNSTTGFLVSPPKPVEPAVKP